MIEHAHDVLTDPVRREAYDREWYAPKAQIDRARRSPAAMLATLAAIVSVGIAAWVATRGPAEAARAARPRHEVQDAVAMAVGRVSRIDMSGRQAPLGVAFAIAERTLVTSCEGLTPDAEVTVHFGKRTAPVRVTGLDEATGLCKLNGGTVGSWPLPLSHQEPTKGQPVYAPVPKSYMPEVIPAIRSAPEPKPAEPEEKAEGPPSGEPVPGMPGPNISPERRKRLEKAFRPPTTVPGDL